MSLAERLAEYVRACFAGIWIQSFEHDDALAEIAQLCRSEDWQFATWDIDQGLRIAGAAVSDDATGSDMLAAVRALGSLGDGSSATLLVLTNFHRFLNSAEIVQAAAHRFSKARTRGRSPRSQHELRRCHMLRQPSDRP